MERARKRREANVVNDNMLSIAKEEGIVECTLLNILCVNYILSLNYAITKNFQIKEKRLWNFSIRKYDENWKRKMKSLRRKPATKVLHPTVTNGCG